MEEGGSAEKTKAIRASMADEAAGEEPGLITIQCKHGKNTHAISISLEASINDLKEKLQHLTNTHPRGQKLIFKGKVLDTNVRLKDAGFANNAKLMMIGTAGVHQGSATQKLAPLFKEPLHKPSATFRDISFGSSGGRSGGFKVFDKSTSAGEKMLFNNAWEATGIISLRDRNYMIIPSRVWAIGPAARVLDLAGNSLGRFPADVSQLVNLQKLRLSANGLKDHQIDWQGLITLKHLTTFALDHNLLTRVPAELGLLSELRVFSAAHNKLVHVCEEVGNLSKLEKLDLSHNCLKDLPPSLGQCHLLIEANFSANFLRSIPSSFADITKLKALNLDNNALKTIPSNILKDCVELVTLSLHGNEVTVEFLRELDGWAEFDERRRAKHSKQLEFNVLDSSGGFDEGADSQQWHHW